MISWEFLRHGLRMSSLRGTQHKSPQKLCSFRVQALLATTQTFGVMSPMITNGHNTAHTGEELVLPEPTSAVGEAPPKGHNPSTTRAQAFKPCIETKKCNCARVHGPKALRNAADSLSSECTEETHNHENSAAIPTAIHLVHVMYTQNAYFSRVRPGLPSQQRGGRIGRFGTNPKDFQSKGCARNQSRAHTPRVECAMLVPETRLDATITRGCA